MEINEPMHNGILSGNKSGKELGFIDRFFFNDLVLPAEPNFFIGKFYE